MSPTLPLPICSPIAHVDPTLSVPESISNQEGRKKGEEDRVEGQDKSFGGMADGYSGDVGQGDDTLGHRASTYAARTDSLGRPLKSALANHDHQAGRRAGHRSTHSVSSSSSSKQDLFVSSPGGSDSKGLSLTSTSSIGKLSTERPSDSPKSTGGSSRRNSESGGEPSGLAALQLGGQQEYDRKVGFDLLGEPLHDAEPNDFSFTLQSKSKNYSRNRNSRTFLVATDVLSHSQNALEWTLDTLVDDGDELVALRVLELNSTSSWGRTKLIDHVRSQEAKARQEAEALMSQIMAHNDETKISIIVEFVVGEVKQTIKSMVGRQASERPSPLAREGDGGLPHVLRLKTLDRHVSTRLSDHGYSGHQRIQGSLAGERLKVSRKSKAAGGVYCNADIPHSPDRLAPDPVSPSHPSPSSSSVPNESWPSQRPRGKVLPSVLARVIPSLSGRVVRPISDLSCQGRGLERSSRA